MAASVDTPSPSHLCNETSSFMDSSRLFSPSSDKRFWSALHGRIDFIVENRNPKISTTQSMDDPDPLPADQSVSSLGRNAAGRAQLLKEDTMLLLRGFDSISFSLSQLSDNLDGALQGARDLGKPPSLTDIFHSSVRNKGESEEGEDEEDSKKGKKRKLNDSDENSETGHVPKGGDLKKAKNLAVSMAAKAASIARELKSIKSELCFMQERYALLEEENSRLRKGSIRPDEDDLMRLQMEALLAEKSRLANENANLVRENQCLHQLVEYHQLTSQDLSASYEEVICGMCLDFSSPPSSLIAEGEDVNQAPPSSAI